MSKRRPGRTTARDFPRTTRLNHLIQEIVADEVERLDDERLGFFTVVAVEVEPDLRHAVVWYSAIGAEEGEALAEALEEHRPRMQRAVARQARLKRTPELAFKLDEVTRAAARLEDLMRDLHGDEPTAE